MRAALWRRSRAMFCLVVVTFSLLTIGLLKTGSKSASSIFIRYRSAFDDNNNSSITETYDVIKASCIIPVLQPEQSWKGKLSPLPPCSLKHPRNSVRISNGSIIVDDKTPDGQPIKCSYKPIVFKTDFKFEAIADSSPLEPGDSQCLDENMFVECTLASNRSVIVFQQPIRCIFQKPSVISRSVTKKLSDDRIFNDDQLNIVMIGFDSMSHVGWVEQMPNTTSYLTELGAVFFDGYNIVGDGTTAAILGLASGYLEEELHESRRGFAGAKQIDDFPLIFYQLKDEAGYATLWDEEQIAFGTFHYRLLGFAKPPVDHYGRIFRGFDENSKVHEANCYGSQGHLEEQLRLFDQLFEAYPDPFRKFALIFSSIYTHSSESEGFQSIARFDDFFQQEIQSWKKRGFLDNTLFIVFSDHGSRYSGSRATQRGKISERLPLLSLVFPAWFQEKYKGEIMSNLRLASKRLTTPFDLHETLLDVAALKSEPNTPKRGSSFFEPIPEERNCNDAGVMPHWCTCLQPSNKGDSLSVHDTLVRKCTNAFEKFVNEDLLARFIRTEQCNRLTVTDVMLAKRFTLGSDVVNFVKTIDGHGRKPSFKAGDKKVTEEYLQISFMTQPGNGQWEVTFDHKPSSGEITLNLKQISRTNKYGSAPWCIQDSFPHLRPFCYCKGKMPEEKGQT